MMQTLKSLFFCVAAVIFLVGCASDQYLPTDISGYARVDQGKLFYKRIGSGEPILVVHGGPGLDHTYLLPQMLELAKDHELIFYDQRGSGKSLDAVLDQQYVTIEQFTKDLEDVRGALGIDKVILMGHSWGALLCIPYALHYPQHVSKLILLNPAPADYKGWQEFEGELNKKLEPIKPKIASFFDPKEFEKLKAQEIQEVYRNLFSVYFADPHKTRYLTLDMTRESAISGHKVLMGMLTYSVMIPKFTLFSALLRLKVPTLVICGNQDAVPASTVQDIKKSMPSAEIVPLQNCGHFPFIEQPNQLFETIRDFLQEGSSF
jgi:proline iminopeptidase